MTRSVFHLAIITIISCDIISASLIDKRDWSFTTSTTLLDNNENENSDFETLLNETNSQLDGKLDVASMREILHRLNEQCLQAEEVFQSLGVDLNDGINEEDFINASFIIAYYLQQNRANTTCNGEQVESSQAASQILFKSGEVCRQDISSLIKIIDDNGKYHEDKDSVECFGSASVISHCSTDPSTIARSVMSLVVSMVRGLCLLPEPEHFHEELYEQLDSRGNGYITEEVFADLLAKFKLGGSGNDDDDHHAHEEHDDHDDDHEGPDHDEGDHDDHDDDHEGPDHDEGDHDDHDDDHEERNHDEEGEESGDHGDYDEYKNELNIRRRKRNVDDHENMTKCYSTSQLLVIAGRQTDTHGKVVLTSDGLKILCPAILQQYVSNACAKEDDHQLPSNRADYTVAMKYGYGTVSVLIISLLAFGGLLLFPSIGSTSYKLTMQFFIALGVGTLSGDALLHLIPEVVGLHNHEGDEHDHNEEEEGEESQKYIYRLLVVVAGIYVFYLFENVLRLWNQLSGSNITFHHHDDGEHHGHHDEGRDAGTHHVISRTTVGHGEVQKDEIKVTGLASSENSLNNPPKETVCFRVTPVGIMVLIGDALHNFGDGLALGVAFSSSWVAGLSASIAIFCHELPHEFGDFAIYIKNGLSKWQALGLNFVAACCAFIGLYIGLSVSENADAREWMLAVIAGMFLYISLVDVLHEMIEEKSAEHPLLQFFLQNLGMCLGWAIMLLLALYEGDLRGALSG